MIPPFTTSRLVLRDFTPGDRAALDAYRSDPRYQEFAGPDARWTTELLEMFLRWVAERPRQNFQLAIVERAVIGSVGVRCKGCDAGVAEFGIEIAPSAWGRGLATEASRALLAFAFRELRVGTLTGISVTQNHRVARLLGALGFRSAGARPGPEWMRARGWTETRWQLTARDWDGA